MPTNFTGTVYVYEQKSAGAVPDKLGNLSIDCPNGIGYVRSFDDWPELFHGNVLDQNGIAIPVVDGIDSLNAAGGNRFAFDLGAIGVASVKGVSFKYAFCFVGDRDFIKKTIATPALFSEPKPPPIRQ
ncbi:MAG: hypothetical protein JST40_06425 [Armatimonadetes bacterium]|nr:hypothetical protein [Armatimonadota bacterium]